MLRRNISFTLFEKFITSIVGASVSIYFINYLGPEKYGVFSYLFSLVYLFGILTFPGINNIVVKHISQGKNASYLVSAALYFSIITSGIASCIFFIFINLEDYNLLLYSIFSALTIFNTVASVFKSYFTGSQQIDFLVKVNLFIFLIINSVKFLAIYFQFDFIFFFLLVFFETILQILLFGYFFFEKNKLFVHKKVFKIFKILIIEAMPLFLTSLLIILYIRIDQVMIKHFAGFKELGQYSACVRLVDMIYMISPIIITSLYPFLSKLFKQDRLKYIECVQDSIYLLSFLSIPFVIFTLVYSNELIGFIFSNKFDRGGIILQILILSTPLVFWNSLLYKILIIERKMKINFYSSITSLIVNVSLNFFLIPINGAVGAAIATIISYGIFIFIIPFVSSLRLYIFDILKSILSPLFLGIVSLVLINQISQYFQVIISGILFLCIYIGLTGVLYRFQYLEKRLANSFNTFVLGRGNDSIST